MLLSHYSISSPETDSSTSQASLEDDSEHCTIKYGVSVLTLENLTEIVQHLDLQTIVSLLLVNKTVRKHVQDLVPGYERTIIFQKVGRITLEKLKQDAKTRSRADDKPSRSDVSTWMDSKYPGGLTLPNEYQNVGNVELQDGLRRRKNKIAVEILGIDWDELFKVNSDPRVLVVVPFVVAKCLILSTTSSLLSKVTRQTAAWIFLPLQESSLIAAHTLSCDPLGASFVAGAYLQRSTNPADYNCIKLDNSITIPLLYSLEGKYGGWTWDWVQRWLTYLADLLSKDPTRLSIKHYQKLSGLNPQLSPLDVLKPRLVVRMPDSVAASVGARYGMELALIVAQDSLSKGNPGQAEYEEILKEGRKPRSNSTLPFINRGYQSKYRLNFDVPLACDLLRTEEDDNTHFTGVIRDLFSPGGMRLRLYRVEDRYISFQLPVSTAFGLGLTGVAGVATLLSSSATHIRVSASFGTTSSREFDLSFVPEKQGQALPGLVVKVDDHHYRTLRRFIGQVLKRRKRLDREVLTPVDLEDKVGSKMLKKLISHAQDHIESRHLTKGVVQIQENSGSTGREVFPANIAYYSQSGHTYRTLQIAGRHARDRSNGAPNAVERYILKLTDSLVDDALRQGLLPPFPPKEPGEKNPGPINGSICVRPPHYFNQGDKTYVDPTTLVKYERQPKPPNTASEKIVRKINELETHISAQHAAEAKAAAAKAGRTSTSESQSSAKPKSNSTTPTLKLATTSKSQSSAKPKSNLTTPTLKLATSKTSTNKISQPKQPLSKVPPSKASSTSPPESTVLSLSKRSLKPGSQMKLAFKKSLPPSSAPPPSQLTAVRTLAKALAVPASTSSQTSSLPLSKKRKSSESSTSTLPKKKLRKDTTAERNEEKKGDEGLSPIEKYKQAVQAKKEKKEDRFKAEGEAKDEEERKEEEGDGREVLVLEDGEESDDDVEFVSETVNGVKRKYQ